MLDLAMRAFSPAKPPFPLLHVDTTWKFRDMYAFRDRIVPGARGRTAGPRQSGGPGDGHQPVRPRLRGPHQHHEDRGAQAGARRARLRCGLRRARRDEERSRAKERIFSFRTAQHTLGPQEPASRAVAPVQRPQAHKASRSAYSRSPTGPSWTSGCTSIAHQIPIVPLYLAARAPGGRARRNPDHGRRRPLPPRAKARRPSMRRVRFRTLGCYPLSGAIESDADTCRRSSARCCCTTSSERQGRADRPRQRGVDGAQEAGGLLLSSLAPDGETRSDIAPARGARAQEPAALSASAAPSTTARAR